MRDLQAHSQKQHLLEIGGRAARIKVHAWRKKKLICVEGVRLNRYHIAGNFCMVQNFAIFVDSSATVK